MRKLMLAAWMTIAGTCLAQQIDLKSLDQFAAKAKSKTEINMDESMVKSAAEFLNQDKKDEAAFKKSIKDMKGFFLRSYEFDKNGPSQFKLEDLKPILDQLKGPNWTSFLRNQENNEQTEIWFHRTNGLIDGLLLVSAEPGEITVINAVGLTKLEDLSALGEFGLLAAESALPSPPNSSQTQGQRKPGAAPKPEGQKNDDN
jgi:Domain of unknown function (DUF4252)